MNRAEINRLIAACRVPDKVREQRKGLWEIRRFAVPENPQSPGDAFIAMMCRQAGLENYRHYTALLRDTLATMHRGFGDVVMEDSPRELRKHLPILTQAHGNVLISGLGLGCVVRGLLSRPEVKHIDVIEIEPHVIELVWPEFEGNDRVKLHVGDALEVAWSPHANWDFAWHDIWSEEESLPVLHMKLLLKYDERAARQGAWEFPRPVKRITRQKRPRMLV